MRNPCCVMPKKVCISLQKWRTDKFLIRKLLIVFGHKILGALDSPSYSKFIRKEVWEGRLHLLAESPQKESLNSWTIMCVHCLSRGSFHTSKTLRTSYWNLGLPEFTQKTSCSLWMSVSFTHISHMNKESRLARQDKVNNFDNETKQLLFQ